ncbi:hypothetical protein J2751_002157 [Halorubrum alkaliphilum]|uniref:RING-type E3 ubiquitin transferase n=1 Tax=Halorubrum alkaliphilum TaxID=261290 RepID=A0A8T4GHB4_9EURY|nr:hypothetical protein [Halorubrum alkaliphilum]MBP1923119.1 hypothetical protein [Halorubrum alkaliphilum]
MSLQFDVPVQLGLSPVTLVLALLVLIVGVAVALYGLSGSVTALRTLRASDVDPMSLAGDDRRVRVVGRTESVGEVLPAPLTDGDALCLAYEVSEYRTQGKTQSWSAIDSGEAGVPFRVVVDGTGVRVDPARATFVLGLDESIRVRSSEEPPDRIRRFVDAFDAVDETHPGYDVGPFTVGRGPDRRYRQRLIRPGDEVTVVGDASAFPDAPVGEVKSRIADGNPFVVSDASPRRTALRLIGRSALPLVGGCLLVVIAVAFLGPVWRPIVG